MGDSAVIYVGIGISDAAQTGCMGRINSMRGVLHRNRVACEHSRRRTKLSSCLGIANPCAADEDQFAIFRSRGAPHSVRLVSRQRIGAAVMKYGTCSANSLGMFFSTIACSPPFIVRRVKGLDRFASTACSRQPLIVVSGRHSHKGRALRASQDG